MGNRTFIFIFAVGVSLFLGNVAVAEDCSILGQAQGKCKTGLYNSAPKAKEPFYPYRDQAAKDADTSRRLAEQTKQAGASVKKSPYAGNSCHDVPVRLQELDYVEINFEKRRSETRGRCVVVSGSTDGDAAKSCPQGSYLINPGNPQYRKNADNTRNGLGHNDLGYYFCMTGGDFNKRRMCEEMGTKHPELSVKFNARTAGGDGDCLCGSANSKYITDCAQADLAAKAAGQCKKEEGFLPNPNKGEGQEACICDTQSGFKDDGKKGCQKVAAEAPAGTNKLLADCVKKHEEKAKECETKALAAKQTCDQKNPENPEVNDALSATSQASGLFMNKNTGTGKITQCIQAGAVAQSPRIILNSMKESCDANFTECNNSCGEEKIQEYKKECGDIANQIARDAVETNLTIDNSKEMKFFNERLAAIEEAQSEGTKICKEDASKNRSILSDVLSGLGKSVAAATRCACQLASTMTGTQSTCDSLPTSEECTANPSLAGCPAVFAVDICTPGSSNYSYLGCSCQQNPAGMGCPQYVAAAKGMDGFAGAGIGNGSSTGGGASFGVGDGGAGSGLGGGDLNLNGNNANELASGTKTPGVSSGFLSGGGGGGGGSLGATPGGGPEGAAGGEGDGESKGGLGGAFGFVKSIAGSLFGGGNKKTDALGSKTNSNFNMNKYRPNGGRGVANHEYGGKNVEIWNMMHDRYDYNQTTFISNP